MHMPSYGPITCGTFMCHQLRALLSPTWLQVFFKELRNLSKDCQQLHCRRIGRELYLYFPSFCSKGAEGQLACIAVVRNNTFEPF